VGVGVAVVVEVAGRVDEDVDGTGVLLEDDGGSDAPPQALIALQSPLELAAG